MACELMSKEYGNIRKFVFIGHWPDRALRFAGPPRLSTSNWPRRLKSLERETLRAC